MIINRHNLLVALLSTSLLSCSSIHAIGKFEADCSVSDRAVTVRYTISGGGGDVYQIDTKVIRVRELNELLGIQVGRQKELEGLMYNSFAPPENIKIGAGQVVNGDVTLDKEEWDLKTTGLRSIVLSVIISDDNLMSGQEIVDPHEFFKAVREHAKIYEARCIVHPPAAPSQ